MMTKLRGLPGYIWQQQINTHPIWLERDSRCLYGQLILCQVDDTWAKGLGQMFEHRHSVWHAFEIYHLDF